MPRFRDLSHTAKPSDAVRVKDPKSNKRTIDPAALELIVKAENDGVKTAFDRFTQMQPQCQFGYKGLCCRFCIMGPCRLKTDDLNSKGICGASAWTIVARGVGTLILTGAASHNEHARHIAHALMQLSEGKAPDYKVTDPDKLRRVAKMIGLATEGKDDMTLVKEVSVKALEDFSRLPGFGENLWIKSTLNQERLDKYNECNVMPAGNLVEIADLLAEAHIGNDDDPVNIIFNALKVSLTDYAGMHLASDLSDVLFGTPKPIVTEANLGVLDAGKINIAVHGHNPLLSEKVVEAAEELEAEAKAAGAQGLNIVGMCCTGNEVLMRKGIPLATSFASTELAIVTGAMDAVVVDVQCIMPGIKQVAECYHTKIITTSNIAKLPGSYHIPFEVETALEQAKQIIRLGIESYKNRNGQAIQIPNVKHKVVAGFSSEALMDLFASVNPDNPIRVLNDAILSGQIKGVVLFAGCNNIKRPQDESHIGILKEMLKNDVFVLATGCSAQAFAKHGFLNPEALEEYAGEGLKAFVKTLEEKSGMTGQLPPAFFMGSCVDNTRASDILVAMAKDLGADTPKVPFVASAPEAMSGKAVAIGSWFVTLGVPVHVGSMPPLEGSELFYSIATQIASDVYGGYFMFELDPEISAKKILDALEYRTWKLGVHKQTAEKFNTALCQNY